MLYIDYQLLCHEKEIHSILKDLGIQEGINVSFLCRDVYRENGHIQKTQAIISDGKLEDIYFIRINPALIGSDKAVETIAHECRHLWQYETLHNAFEGYVPASVDYDAYYSHPSEVDAREYAMRYMLGA